LFDIRAQLLVVTAGVGQECRPGRGGQIEGVGKEGLDARPILSAVALHLVRIVARLDGGAKESSPGP
jgi:hypothetical protein